MTAVLLAPGILGSAAPMAVNPAGLRLSVAPGPGPSFRLAAECAAPEYARRYVSNWAGIFVKDFAAKSRDLQTAGQAAGSVF